MTNPVFCRILFIFGFLLLQGKIASNLEASTSHSHTQNHSHNQSVRIVSESSEKDTKSGQLKGLDWTKRPQDVQSEIESAFSDLSGHAYSGWGKFNGETHYYLMGIDEYALLKKIILEAPSTQKEFYVLDIGAGNFSLGEGIANFINGDKDLPNDITVHIFGIRGEKNAEDPIIKDKRCVRYNLGAFPIENMESEFKKLGFDLEGKLDLIVSRWTFVHFVDPVGTFVQAYNLLRPQTGLVLMDGFRLLFEDSKEGDYWFQEVYEYGPKSTYNFGRQMMNFFAVLQAPFLVRNKGERAARYQFIVRRPNASPIAIPMDYITKIQVATRSPHFTWGSLYVTQYKRLFSPLKDNAFTWPNESDAYGDYDLFQWLSQIKDCFGYFPVLWQPFMPQNLTEKSRFYLENVKKDREEEKIRLEEERKKKDQLRPSKEAVKAFNALIDSVSERDWESFQKYIPMIWKDLDADKRNTALLTAMEIYEKDERYFDILLNAGVDVNFVDGPNGTPLHNLVWLVKWKDISLDKAKELAKKLIAKGAQVDFKRRTQSKNYMTGKTDEKIWPSPLDDAKKLEDKDFFQFLSAYAKEGKEAMALQEKAPLSAAQLILEGGLRVQSHSH